MLIKTSELTGPTLRWAVAQCEGLAYRNDEKYGQMHFRPAATEGSVTWDNRPLHYSTDWSQGGPIIERERIDLECSFEGADWSAMSSTRKVGSGPTPLIAAMRCYVASKLGDEVDVPEELKP